MDPGCNLIYVVRIWLVYGRGRYSIRSRGRRNGRCRSKTIRYILIYRSRVRYRITCRNMSRDSTRSWDMDRDIVGVEELIGVYPHRIGVGL